MKVNRIELLTALQFIRDNANQYSPIIWQQQNERLTIYDMKGTRYFLNYKGNENAVFGFLDCSTNTDFIKLIKILSISTDVETFDVQYSSKGHIKNGITLSAGSREYKIETIAIDEELLFVNRKQMPSSFLVLDESKISVMKKAKAYLSKDDYRPHMQHFIINDKLLFATDSYTMYSNRFEYGHNVLLPVELASDKFLDCKVFFEDGNCFACSKNWEVCIDSVKNIDYPEQTISTLHNFYNNKSENRLQDDVLIELDVQHLVVACKVACSADIGGRLVLDLSADTELKRQPVEHEILHEFIHASIPDIHSHCSSNAQIVVNSKFLLQAVNTLGLNNKDMLKCAYVINKGERAFRYLYIKVKSEVIMLCLLYVAENEIQSERERLAPDYREARFKVSGYEHFEEFVLHGYRTKKEVEFSELEDALDKNYVQRLKTLITVDEDRVRAAHHAKTELDIILPQIASITQAHKEEFALSDDEQKLILLNAELRGVKKLQASEENPIKIDSLKKSISDLNKIYASILDKKTEFLMKEKKQYSDICFRDAPMLKLNIDQVVNSNSHILIERAALELEYAAFQKNPKDFVRTTKQVREERLQKKGKKVVVE